MNKALILIFLNLNVFVFGQNNCKNCEKIFKTGDFSKAKTECILASEKGDPICQAYLGIIYLSESETDNAKIWFEKSANQGNAIGQNGLGYLYQHGFGGLTKDLEKANKWFLKSAQQGNTDSQFWLGENLFLNGNKVEGYNWTLKASLNGSRDAQFNLGTMLHNGDGIKEDKDLAFIWFIISASKGNKKAKEVIDNLKSKISNEQYQKLIIQTKDFIKLNPKVM